MSVKSIIYFIFLSVFTYWSEVSIFTESNAASVIPAAAPNKPIKINIRIKKKRLPEPIAEADSFPVYFMQISDFISPPPYIDKNKKNRVSEQAKKNNAPPVLYTNLYEQGKQFVVANKNNQLLQDSLVAFDQTKQFLMATDIALYTLTQDLLLSLNLADPEQKKLYLLQQNNKATVSTKNSYSQSFREQSETIRLQNLNKLSNEEQTLSNANVFKLIFNYKNLYYLIAVVVLFYIIKQIIKFMFMKDQYNQQKGR